MPPSLTSRVELVLQATLVNPLDLDAIASVPLVVRRAIEMANGAGALQANMVFHDQRTLAPSATDSLDLAGGGLLDPLGQVVAPARLRAILIYSSPANLNNLTCLGNAAAIPVLNTPATTFTLPPGGLFLMAKPDAVGILVTPTTADIIQIVNAAGVNSVTYDLVILGGNT